MTLVIALIALLVAVLQGSGARKRVDALASRVAALELAERGRIAATLAAMPPPAPPAPAPPSTPAAAAAAEQAWHHAPAASVAHDTQPAADAIAVAWGAAPPGIEFPTDHEASSAQAASAPSTGSPVRTPRTFGGRSLESILAEHALSIVGGLFVLVAAVLFLTFAIDRGWIGPGLRMLLATAFGSALIAVGVRLAGRLDEPARTGRAIGSLHGVLTGVGIAVLFLTIVASVRLFELVGATAGCTLALVVGAGAVVVARAWRSQDLAAFGTLGALASPVLLDAPTSGATLPLVFIALVATLGVAVLDGWPRLIVAAELVTIVELGSWLTSGPPAEAAALVVLAGWWALCAGAAVVHAARAREDARTSVVGSVFVASLAFASLYATWIEAAGDVAQWHRPTVVAGFAAVHVVAGLALLRRRDLEVLATTVLCLAGALAAVAVADSAGSGATVAAWAAEATATSVLWWRLRSGRAALVAGALALLALVRLEFDAAPLTLLTAPEPLSLSVVVALTGTLAATIVACWFARRWGAAGSAAHRVVERVLDGLAVVLGWQLGATVFAALVREVGGGVQEVGLALGAWTGAFAIVVLAAAATRHRVDLAVIAAIGTAASSLLLLGFGAFDARALAVVLPLALFAALAPIALGRGIRPAPASVDAVLDEAAPVWVALWQLGAGVLVVLTVDPQLETLLAGTAFSLGRAVALTLLVALAAAGVRVLTARALGARSVETRTCDLVAASSALAAVSGAIASASLDRAPTIDLAGWHAGSLPVAALWLAASCVAFTLARLRDVSHVAWWGAAVGALVPAWLIVPDAHASALVAALALAFAAAITAWSGRPGARTAGVMPLATALVALAALVTTGLALVRVPPTDLLEGIDVDRVAAVLTAACAAVPFAAAWRLARHPELRPAPGDELAERFRAAAPALLGASLTAAWYALSAAVVAFYSSGVAGIEGDAQVALTLTWALLGLAALVVGARRSAARRGVRTGGYVLLGGAALKTVVVDTAQLDAPLRVLVFLGVGLLLLGAAWVEGRLREDD